MAITLGKVWENCAVISTMDIWRNVGYNINIFYRRERYNEEKKQSFLWTIFLAIFSVNMLAVIMLCVLQTQNNLPVSKMVLLSPMFIAAWMILYFVLHKIQNLLEKVTPIALPAFFVIYGIVLYVLAITGRGNPVHDQEAVYQGALYFAGLSEDMPWEYFARCDNNTMPALILGGVFRIGSLGGIVDPYYFAVFLNVVQVLVSMYCLFRLSEVRNGVVSGWIAVLMLAGCVPIVGHTLIMYTDSMSFCFSILALYIWRFSKVEEKQKRSWFTYILIGVLLGVGGLIKMTALIAGVALLGYGILCANKQKIFGSIAIIVVSLVVITAGKTITKMLPCESMRDAYGLPSVSYFLGIGLKGNGGYVDNQEYSATLNTIYGLEAKKAWSDQYIRENLGEFLNKEHIIQKIRYNFASGGMGCAIFVQNLNENHWLYRTMHHEGDLFWRYNMITTPYMYAFYGLILTGMVLAFVKRIEKDATFSVSLIAIFGIMLYLMLFEANNRQLYNHLPWFVLASTCGLSEIWNTIRMKKC